MIARLALSGHDQPAAVRTTLGLVRNLGSIMGVEMRRWVLQNAVRIGLGHRVRGPQEVRDEIIANRSPRLLGLDEVHAMQGPCLIAGDDGVRGHAQWTKRATFSPGLVFATIVVVWMLSTRLPRWQKS